jgi:hypothetical protein
MVNGAGLAGLRVLVVEDEMLISMFIAAHAGSPH